MTLYRSVAAAGSVPAAAPPTFGVSLGHRELAEADHWILSLTPRPQWAVTHLVAEPHRHVAISLTTSEVVDSADGMAAGAAAARSGKFGRAVIFPGAAALVGVLTVAEVLALSAIDRVEVLGSGAAGPEDQINTHDFVRPQFRDGELVLTVMPGAGGVLVPFETANPTPCCENH